MTEERFRKRGELTNKYQVTDAKRKSIGTDETISESAGRLLDHKMSHLHSPQIFVVD